MKELLKKLACFGCPYCEDCEDEWEDGHSHCDEMIEKAKYFVAKTGICRQNEQLSFSEEPAERSKDE